MAGQIAIRLTGEVLAARQCDHDISQVLGLTAENAVPSAPHTARPDRGLAAPPPGAFAHHPWHGLC